MNVSTRLEIEYFFIDNILSPDEIGLIDDDSLLTPTVIFIISYHVCNQEVHDH